MKVHRHQILALEVFSSVNIMKPYYNQNLLGKNTRSKRRQSDLIIPFHNTASFGNKSIKEGIRFIYLKYASK